VAAAPGIDNSAMELTLAPMAKDFLPNSIDQRLLVPPDMRDWWPKGHLARLVDERVEQLDRRAIYTIYPSADDRGRRGYHPAMRGKLLVYAYCVGKPSSRTIERATYEDVAFGVLSGDQHPDHDSIADFRKRHLKALGALFAQVLVLCQKAGLVKRGHVAIDGTKMAANASKHKAMSYGRMAQAESKLQQQVDRLLAEVERIDAREDAQYGKDKRGDELPAELQRRESRLMGLPTCPPQFRRIAFPHNLLKLASTTGRANPEQVTMSLVGTMKRPPSHTSRREGARPCRVPPYNHLRHGELEGERPRSPRTGPSRRRTGGAFAAWQKPDGLLGHHSLDLTWPLALMRISTSARS
jgi:transposase